MNFTDIKEILYQLRSDYDDEIMIGQYTLFGDKDEIGMVRKIEEIRPIYYYTRKDGYEIFLQGTFKEGAHFWDDDDKLAYKIKKSFVLIGKL